MLKRFKRAFLLAVSTSVIVMALVFVVVRAGSLTPPGPVGSTMRSLEEIYDTLAGTFDSSGESADIDGNIIEQLKYISGMTLQQIYDNSVSPVTITDSSASAILTIQQTGAGNIIELKDATSTVFSIDNAGNITMGAPTLTSADSAQISSGGASDLALNAGSGKIKAAAGSAFYNENGYPIAASGEEILRASIPIFGYDFPARYANSAVAIKISRDITLDANSFPAVPAGVNRRYKFKIQYANDAANVNSSTWEIYAFPGPALFAALNPVPNTGIASLDEAEVYYSEAIAALPGAGVKWYLQVTAPAGTIIQIYQIELLGYDVLQ